MSEESLVPDYKPVKPNRLITDREFRRRLGDISAITLWRLRNRDPSCPKPVRMLGAMNLVPEAESDSYIASLVAARDAK